MNKDLYLRLICCDSCGRTFSRRYCLSEPRQRQRTVEEARSRGWYVQGNRALCPRCDRDSVDKNM